MHHPVYVFRHGETVWNAEKRAQGVLDSPLTEAGREQARAMGRALARELREAGHAPADVIVRSSPLGRVRETLALAAEEAGLLHDERCFDHRLREMSWGDWDGLTGPEIEARWPGEMAARRLNRWTYEPPGGENYIMAVARAQAALGRYRGAGSGAAGRRVRTWRHRARAARIVPAIGRGRDPRHGPAAGRLLPPAS